MKITMPARQFRPFSGLPEPNFRLIALPGIMQLCILHASYPPGPEQVSGHALLPAPLPLALHLPPGSVLSRPCFLSCFRPVMIRRSMFPALSKGSFGLILDRVLKKFVQNCTELSLYCHRRRVLRIPYCLTTLALYDKIYTKAHFGVMDYGFQRSELHS